MTNGDRNWNSSFMNEFWDHVEGWRPDWHCFCPKLDISKIKFLCSNPTVTWSSKTARGFQMRKNISASGFCSGIQQTQQRAKIERKRKRPLFIKCIFTWCPNKIVLWTKITQNFPFHLSWVLWSKSFCTLKVLWYYKTCQDFKWVWNSKLLM